MDLQVYLIKVEDREDWTGVLSTIDVEDAIRKFMKHQYGREVTSKDIKTSLGNWGCLNYIGVYTTVLTVIA